MSSKTSIRILFDTLEQQHSIIPDQLLNKCADEYDEITQKIPTEKRPQKDLISLIQCAFKDKDKKYVNACQLLSKAKTDYYFLIKELDITRQGKGQNKGGGQIQTHDQSKIAGLTMPQDNHNSTSNLKEIDQTGKPQHIDSAPTNQQVDEKGESHSNTEHRSRTAKSENSKRDNVNKPAFPSKTQISRDASNQLKQNNPNIADLSDTNRPTKLAERFSELYDNEWTNAYEDLHNNLRLHEKTTTALLIAVVKGAYTFCTENAELQINDLQMCCKNIVTFGSKKDKTDDISKDQTGDKSSLVLYRKSVAGLAVNRLQKTFCDDPSYLHNLCSKFGISNTPSPTGPMVLFANKCVELCWWMCVQDPPIWLDATTNTGFNSTLYRAYTKSGTSVDFYVWPALMLYKEGPVLMKGVAQCK